MGAVATDENVLIAVESRGKGGGWTHRGASGLRRQGNTGEDGLEFAVMAVADDGIWARGVTTPVLFRACKGWFATDSSLEGEACDEHQRTEAREERSSPTRTSSDELDSGRKFLLPGTSSTL